MGQKEKTTKCGRLQIKEKRLGKAAGPEMARHEHYVLKRLSQGSLAQKWRGSTRLSEKERQKKKEPTTHKGKARDRQWRKGIRLKDAGKRESPSK